MTTYEDSRTVLPMTSDNGSSQWEAGTERRIRAVARWCGYYIPNLKLEPLPREDQSPTPRTAAGFDDTLTHLLTKLAQAQDQMDADHLQQLKRDRARTSSQAVARFANGHGFDLKEWQISTLENWFVGMFRDEQPECAMVIGEHSGEVLEYVRTHDKLRRTIFLCSGHTREFPPGRLAPVPAVPEDPAQPCENFTPIPKHLDRCANCGHRKSRHSDV